MLQLHYGEYLASRPKPRPLAIESLTSTLGLLHGPLAIVSALLCCPVSTPYLYSAVADTGFVEGGSDLVWRAKRARKFGGHAHFCRKPRPFSSVFERSYLPYLSFHSFSIEIFAKVC